MTDEPEPRFAIQVDSDLWVKIELDKGEIENMPNIIALVRPEEADTWKTREEAEKVREQCEARWPEKFFYIRPHS